MIDFKRLLDLDYLSSKMNEKEFRILSQLFDTLLMFPNEIIPISSVERHLKRAAIKQNFEVIYNFKSVEDLKILDLMFQQEHCVEYLRNVWKIFLTDIIKNIDDNDSKMLLDLRTGIRNKIKSLNEN